MDKRLSAQKIEKITGVGYKTVYQILKNNGQNTRRVGHHSQKYNCNFDFFEKINSEEKAYWLGFLYADGCITHTCDLVLSLSEVDTDHVIKFAKSIESNHPLAKRKVPRNPSKKGSKPCVAINIYSHKIEKDLLKYGLCRRKTYFGKLKLDKIPKKLIRHFWRGMIDGDGCLGVNSRVKMNKEGSRIKKSPYIELCGSFNTMENLQDYILKTFRIKRNIGKRSEFLYRMAFDGELASKIIHRLYDNSTVFLDRKHAIYKTLIDSKLI